MLKFKEGPTFLDKWSYPDRMPNLSLWVARFKWTGVIFQTWLELGKLDENKRMEQCCFLSELVMLDWKYVCSYLITYRPTWGLVVSVLSSIAEYLHYSSLHTSVVVWMGLIVNNCDWQCSVKSSTRRERAWRCGHLVNVRVSAKYSFQS